MYSRLILFLLLQAEQYSMMATPAPGAAAGAKALVGDEKGLLDNTDDEKTDDDTTHRKVPHAQTKFT